MLRADIYFRPNATYVLAQHVTKKGLGISGEPTFKLGAKPEASELGEAVLSCMRQSREGVRTPESRRQSRKEFFRFLGCSSQKALENNSFHVCVYGDPKSVTVRPSHVAATGGFEPLLDLEVSCQAHACDVGSQILQLRENVVDTALPRTRNRVVAAETRSDVIPLQVGDRVVDHRGAEGVIELVRLPSEVDPLGEISVAYSTSSRRNFAYDAHGLTRIQD